jgi:hypothetical protein
MGSTKDPPGLHTSKPGHLHASPGSDSNPRYHELECNLMEALCEFRKGVEEALEEFKCGLMKALEASLIKMPARKRSCPARANAPPEASSLPPPSATLHITITWPEDNNPCTPHPTSSSPVDANSLLATEHPDASILPSAKPVPSIVTACDEPPNPSLHCSSPPSLPRSNLPPSSTAAGGPGSVPEWRQRLSPPPNIHTIDYYRKMGWLRNCQSLEDRCTELEACYRNRRWKRQLATATRKSGGAIPKSGGAKFAHWYRPPPIYQPFHSFHPSHSLMQCNVCLHSIHPYTLF